MLRIVFWNLHRNLRPISLLSQLAVNHDVDLVITAEEPENSELEAALQLACGTEFAVRTGRINKRIRIYARKTVEVSAAIGESHYLVVHRLHIPGKPEILLAGMHGISRLEDELADLNEEASVAADLLRSIEDREQHRRTILIGDFNLNPFDEGMFKAKGFFGVMTKADAAREAAQIKWTRYPLFYNPMWSRLGDLSPGPAGTFYRERKTHLAHFWHTYDQVLVRSALAECFDASSFQIVTQVGDLGLLRNGVPDALNYSDHLPVMVGFDLERLAGAK